MPRPVAFAVFLLLPLVAFLAGCSGPAPYRYRYIPGKTAVLRGGTAIAPASAPARVRAAIDAGNRIAGKPYRYGGGHGRFDDTCDTGYDCSGAASFVLRAAGGLREPMPSKAFRRFGEGGEGDWISVYARRDHVFLVVAGLRFDTGWTHGAPGPRWTTGGRPTNNCVIRHPVGL